MNQLLDEDKISNVKEATVAIGLIEPTKKKPEEIIGTGFIFDERGYVATAGHVAEKTYERYTTWNMNNPGKHVDIAFFKPFLKGGTSSYRIFPLEKFHLVDYQKIHKDAAMPEYLDFAYAKPTTDEKKLPCLKISSSDRLPIYSEVCLSSYPRGKHTFRTERSKYEGKRVNPVLQFGRIGGYLPTDNDPYAYGVQTDIIGTGSSSGGPIVNNDREVVSIATSIVPAYFESENKQTFGDVLFGVTNGLSLLYLLILIETARDHLETDVFTPPILPQRTLTPVNEKTEDDTSL